METSPTTKRITIDDLSEIQRLIDRHRHLIAAARAGHYAVHARPGGEEGFLVVNPPASVHRMIQDALFRATLEIQDSLRDQYNVEIGKTNAESDT